MRASYGATTVPPPASTVTSPASTCAERVLNDWYADAPGATSAASCVPNGVTRRTASGASSSFTARTATYAVPARQRVCAVTVTGASASSGAPKRSISATLVYPAPLTDPVARSWTNRAVVGSRSTRSGSDVPLNVPLATVVQLSPSRLVRTSYVEIRPLTPPS